MSQFEKLLKKIRSLNKNLRFEELQKILEFYGYTMTDPRNGSSHKSFRKTGQPSITIPQHEPIKRVYVEKVRDIIEREEKHNENA